MEIEHLCDFIDVLKCCGNCIHHNDWQQNICPHKPGETIPGGHYCDRWMFDELTIYDRENLKIISDATKD